MSDTPTPQTGAFENPVFLYQQMTWWEFARSLERQLAVANKEIDRLNRYVDTFRSDEQLMGELAAKDAEIAAAKILMAEIERAIEAGNDMEDYRQALKQASK